MFQTDIKTEDSKTSIQQVSHLVSSRLTSQEQLSSQCAPRPYTSEEEKTIQSHLNKKLDPHLVSYRPGPGHARIAYIEGRQAISLANDIFGFNGWSSSVKELTVDFVNEVPGGKVQVGVSVLLRITLKDGTYREDIGYGAGEFIKKADAFQKAKKEATTDALKRTLRSFGEILGNCIYDKQYLQEVANNRRR
ncbi:9983_t:CDS:2 [Paraglomus occultum]|uniref:9983_t:CDS:1 n=1 Tax=Paraglomus occultum TaxID=144539 RepID=A0A9N9BBG7_9GLOM|nr:9983_t:CDS:2 [Paraglomus occultum]